MPSIRGTIAREKEEEDGHKLPKMMMVMVVVVVVGRLLKTERSQTEKTTL